MAENDGGTNSQNDTANSSSNPPAWYNTPPSWYNNSPSHPQPQSPPPNGGPSRNDLMTAIGGLPDQIVNALREAFPTTTPAQPPANNAPPPSNSQPASPPPSTESEPNKPLSFAEWWWKR